MNICVLEYSPQKCINVRSLITIFAAISLRNSSEKLLSRFNPEEFDKRINGSRKKWITIKYYLYCALVQ